MSSALEQRIRTVGERLQKEALENPSPSSESCMDLIQELQKETGAINVSLLESTKIGKMLTKAIKSFKRHKRTAGDDGAGEWEALLRDSDALLSAWKKKADHEVSAKAAAKKKPTAHSNKAGPARTVAEYRLRLVAQKKEIYKDPPHLPPGAIEIEKDRAPPPKRNKTTGCLKFVVNDPALEDAIRDFQPNRTPEEVLRAGSFGGTYFRSITSAVTNVRYDAREVLKDTLPDEWIKGIPMNQLTSQTYRPQVNKYGVKCGGSLGMWESSGWIVDSDPYGWFQWYCRFYQGRRCSDDARQISRWLKSAGPKGRFRSQLCNKILAAQTRHDNKAISPVIRQTLLHWGLEITPSVLEAHRKRVGR